MFLLNFAVSEDALSYLYAANIVRRGDGALPFVSAVKFRWWPEIFLDCKYSGGRHRKILCWKCGHSRQIFHEGTIEAF